mgnify:FL=1
MKYFIIAFCVLMSSCAFFADPETLIRTPSISFNSMDELCNYVNYGLSYKYEFTDYWQAPQETIDKGTGDCEDFCIFVGYFARKMGYEVYLVAVETPKGTHMIIMLNGVPYEAQTLRQYQYYDRYPKIARLTMDEALRKCYFTYGSRSVGE